MEACFMSAADSRPGFSEQGRTPTTARVVGALPPSSREQAAQCHTAADTAGGACLVLSSDACQRLDPIPHHVKHALLSPALDGIWDCLLQPPSDAPETMQHPDDDDRPSPQAQGQ